MKTVKGSENSLKTGTCTAHCTESTAYSVLASEATRSEPYFSEVSGGVLYVLTYSLTYVITDLISRDPVRGLG